VPPAGSTKRAAAVAAAAADAAAAASAPRGDDPRDAALLKDFETRWLTLYAAKPITELCGLPSNALSLWRNEKLVGSKLSTTEARSSGTNPNPASYSYS